MRNYEYLLLQSQLTYLFLLGKSKKDAKKHPPYKNWIFWVSFGIGFVVTQIMFFSFRRSTRDGGMRKWCIEHYGGTFQGGDVRREEDGA
jgi:hypothetical protein